MSIELEEAIQTYQELKKRLGKVPSSREFTEVFSKRKLSGLFEGGNSYSRLQEAAGDTPNIFSSEKSDLTEILVIWGELARKTIGQYGKLPVSSDWAVNKLKPSISGIEKSHNIRWSELPTLFVKNFSGIPDWSDVLDKIPFSSSSDEKVGLLENEECFVYLMKDLRNITYKIGISNNPGKRERTLQSEQPKTELVASKKYINRKIALNIEKALHETYSHKRKRGEWFMLDEEDVLEISSTLND